MPRVITVSELPAEYASAARDLIDRYAWLVPTWCHTLTIDYNFEDHDEPRTKAECHADPHYRQARITLYPRFLELPPEEREATIVHEIIHIVTAPLSRIVDDILATARMSEDARKIAENVQRDAEESVVEDFAAAVLRFAEMSVRVTYAPIMERTA